MICFDYLSFIFDHYCLDLDTGKRYKSDGKRKSKVEGLLFFLEAFDVLLLNINLNIYATFCDTHIETRHSK